MLLSEMSPNFHVIKEIQDKVKNNDIDLNFIDNGNEHGFRSFKFNKTLINEIFEYFKWCDKSFVPFLKSQYAGKSVFNIAYALDVEVDEVKILRREHEFINTQLSVKLKE